MNILITAKEISFHITDTTGEEILRFYSEQQHFSVDINKLLSESASVGELFTELTHKAKMAFIKASMEQQSAMDKD